MLLKLFAIGVSHITLDWLKSYLTNRKQQTSCGNKLSDAQPVTFGQHNWTAALFGTYTDDLPRSVEHSAVTLYADDTVLYQFAKDPKLLKEKLNADLLNVAKWLHNNKLTLNLDKTRSMLTGNNKRLELSHFL